MRITRRLFVFSLAAASAALAPQDAAACACLERSGEDMIVEADVIFRGRVISIVPLMEVEPRNLRGMSEDEARDISLVRFRVYDVLKGDVGRRVVVAERRGYATCGSPLALGRIVHVRATRDAAIGLVAGPCDLNEDANGRMTRYLRALM